MNTFIALLRGINVGGHKKVPMTELRELLTKSGLDNVQTYIQSGNVILESSEDSTHNIEGIIQKAIIAHFGFDVSVIVKTNNELQAIFNACPFSEDKKKTSYFVILDMTPNDDLVKIASEKVYEGEQYIIINDCIYFYSAKGYGQVKFNMNFFERKLKVSATSRNYNTMMKLLSLCQTN